MNLFSAPDATDRLILGLSPPPEVADQMVRAADAVRRLFSLQGRPRPHGYLSLRLHDFGEHAGVRRDIVQMASEAAASVEPPGPIELCFDRAEGRMNSVGRFDLVLKSTEPSAPLAAFQNDLGMAMARAGLGRFARRPFEPEILVVENVRGYREVPIEPIRWTATAFILLHGLLGRQQHVPLARWSLLGQPADAADKQD